MIFEINKKYVEKFGNAEEAIKEGYFIEWNDKSIKEAFNNGNGTMNHFKNYMTNNKATCIYKEI